MTQDEKERILNLYERGLLLVKAAGHWQELSRGQSKVSVVVCDDTHYRITQKRLWRACVGWEYKEVVVERVKLVVKKTVKKYWEVV